MMPLDDFNALTIKLARRVLCRNFRAIAKPDTRGPHFRHRDAFLFRGCNAFRFIADIRHSRIHETAMIGKSSRTTVCFAKAVISR